MKITTEWLKEKGACLEGVDWFKNQKETESIALLKTLMSDSKLSWANWLIVRTMSYKEYVGYAVFAAEQVLDIYEKKFPDDKRPREAIEAAKECIKNPSTKNKSAASAAAYAASAASATAYAASAASYAAAYAAYAADAAAAADAASASDAASAASYAADARKKLQLKILNYGLKLLKGVYHESEKESVEVHA